MVRPCAPWARGVQALPSKRAAKRAAQNQIVHSTLNAVAFAREIGDFCSATVLVKHQCSRYAIKERHGRPPPPSGAAPSFAFTSENLAWVRETVAKYPPGKQASAVIPVLWRAQEQNDGWLSEPAIRVTADMLGMAYIRVYEIATFYTMFQLAPVGLKAHIQVCGTTPCMLRGSEELIAVCKTHIAPHAHERSADGNFSWEEVECLGSCANAPMVQIFKDTYEDLTPASFEKLLEGFASGKPPKPGSQTGRQVSAPAGKPTHLERPRAV